MLLWTSDSQIILTETHINRAKNNKEKNTLMAYSTSVSSVHFSSVTQLCLTLCDPMDCSTPGFPLLHQLLELAQIHVHQVSYAIQPSHPLSSPSLLPYYTYPFPIAIEKKKYQWNCMLMWELDCEGSWAPKNWCFWTVVLEKSLESPLDCKEIQPVHSEGDQPWNFFGKNDAKAETPVFWPPHAKSWLIGKDSDAGRDWGQEEKGTTEDEMTGWHHWLNGREFEWTPGVDDGQGGLACCDSWGRKESDTTEWLNWTYTLKAQ